jgi:hypothetical protein
MPTYGKKHPYVSLSKSSTPCGRCVGGEVSSSSLQGYNDCTTIPEPIIRGQPYQLIYNLSQADPNETYNLNYLTNNSFLATFIPNNIFSNVPIVGASGEIAINVAFDNNNNMYVSVDVINIIYKFNAALNQLEPYITNAVIETLFSPVGMAFDSNNTMYVSNFAAASGTIPSVSVYDSAGTYLYTINDSDSLLSKPGDIKFDKNGNLYILNGSTITGGIYDGLYLILQVIPRSVSEPSGNIIYFCSSVGNTTLNRPLFIEFDSYNNGYVTNYGSSLIGTNSFISKITNMNPQNINVYIPSGVGLYGIRGIAIDSQNNLYVTNNYFNNFSILKITPNKTITTFTTKNLNSPRGITFNNMGDLYIANGIDLGALNGNYITQVIYNRYLFNVTNNNLPLNTQPLSITNTTTGSIINNLLRVVVVNSSMSPYLSSPTLTKSYNKIHNYTVRMRPNNRYYQMTRHLYNSRNVSRNASRNVSRNVSRNASRNASHSVSRHFSRHFSRNLYNSRNTSNIHRFNTTRRYIRPNNIVKGLRKHNNYTHKYGRTSRSRYR